MRDSEQKKGVIIIIASVALAVLLLLGSYLLSFAIVESKISQSQSVSLKTYYLAEAGIYETIWKINNNEAAKNNFLNGTLGLDDGIVRTTVFGDNKINYSVSAVSTAAAEAVLVATSTYQISDRESQRVVRVYITKASGSDSPWDFAMFSGVKGEEKDGNIEISGSGVNVTVSGSRFHANNDIRLTGSNGTVTINDGAITASDAIEVSGSNTQIILNNSYQDSPTSTVDMLPIDFDGWAGRATVAYTARQFQNLPSGTILNGIIYVQEAVSLSKSNYHLTVNGVLVLNGYLKLSGSDLTLTINNDPNYGSGLMVNGNLQISGSNAHVAIEGLIYISKELKMSSSNIEFESTGTIIAANIKISGSNAVAHINYQPEYFQPVLDPALNPKAPVVQINHWEEEY